MCKQQRHQPGRPGGAWMLDPPPGWDVFGTHADGDEPLEFWGEEHTEDGLPVWERPRG